MENNKLTARLAMILLFLVTCGSIIDFSYVYAESDDGSNDGNDSGDDDSGDDDSGDDDSGDNDSGDNDSGDNDSGDNDSGDDDSNHLESTESTEQTAGTDSTEQTADTPSADQTASLLSDPFITQNELNAIPFSQLDLFPPELEILNAQLLNCDPSIDSSCEQQQQQVIEDECNDGNDNDSDGFPDKSDPDCVEDCFDGIDNDDDGLDDTQDGDCGGNNSRGNPGVPPGDPSQNDDDSSNSKASDDGNRDDGSSDFTGFLGFAEAQNSPLIIPAKDVYESGKLDLDSDIRNLIILIPQTKNDSRTQQISIPSNLPRVVTISEGTKVTWLNSDPNELHDLMIEEKDTGRQMFSDIDIKYGQTSEFEFNTDGTYSYSYTGMPSTNGIIKVVDRTDIDDNSLTSSTNPILGIGIVSSDQKDSIEDRISQKDYILSTFNVRDDQQESKAQNGSNDDLSYVMMVWAAKLFK